jgi:serine/threonine protein kinase
VAIKVIDTRYRKDPAYTERFLKEARVMAKWRHENIVQVYYADDEAGLLYYVMELIDGQDLASLMAYYVDAGELMPIADILRVGRSVANALDYAHAQGVIHRDVKPSNVLVASDGRVALGDFGMALDVRDGSLGDVFGTPHYISPEQARRSADAVPQSDLYSFGIILYEILTGAVPFNDPSPASVALQHITNKPPAPRSLNPDLPMEVEAVLLKALEKAPRDRYQTGAKLMDALEKALAVTKIPSRLPMPPLPVNVPTILRSQTSIIELTRRGVPKKPVPATRMAAVIPEPPAGAKQKQRPPAYPANPVPQAAPAQRQEKRRSFPWWLVLFLLLAGAGGTWFYRPDLLASIPLPVFAATSPTPPLPTATQTLTPAPSPSPSLLPPTETSAPTLTSTPAPTRTVTSPPLPTGTGTASPTTEFTATNTNTSMPTFTPAPGPTVKYPDGQHFTLFYNESSFVLLSQGTLPRTMSGFIFERLDSDGKPMPNYFGGWVWQGEFDEIRGGYCVTLKIYGNAIPYLDPRECKRGYLNVIQVRDDDQQIFWTALDNSHQFRVLWKDEEVGRCETDAGVCDVYIP